VHFPCLHKITQIGILNMGKKVKSKYDKQETYIVQSRQTTITKRYSKHKLKHKNTT
jgi:hypothetical protein